MQQGKVQNNKSANISHPASIDVSSSLAMSSSKVENFEIPPPPPPVAMSYTTLPALIAFALLVIVVCFVGFSILYFCRCCFLSVVHTWVFQRSASGASTLMRRLSLNNSTPPPYRGLDPSLLQTFPTFLYASVKNLHKEKDYNLECAICLVEFGDDSLLRLLTICCHVFHKECIDLWLRSRKTCPICRVELSSPSNLASPNTQEVVLEEDQNNVQEERRGGDVCIEVEESKGDEEGVVGLSVTVKTPSHEDDDERLFARSHSTGHSMVMIRGGGGEEDKYTLRLPEHVELKVIRAGRNRNNSKSCSSYKDMAMTMATTRPPVAAPCSNCGYIQNQTVLGCSSHSNTVNT